MTTSNSIVSEHELHKIFDEVHNWYKEWISKIDVKHIPETNNVYWIFNWLNEILSQEINHKMMCEFLSVIMDSDLWNYICSSNMSKCPFVILNEEFLSEYEDEYVEVAFSFNKHLYIIDYAITSKGGYCFTNSNVYHARATVIEQVIYNKCSIM